MTIEECIKKHTEGLKYPDCELSELGTSIRKFLRVALTDFAKAGAGASEAAGRIEVYYGTNNDPIYMQYGFIASIVEEAINKAVEANMEDRISELTKIIRQSYVDSIDASLAKEEERENYLLLRTAVADLIEKWGERYETLREAIPEDESAADIAFRYIANIIIDLAIAEAGRQREEGDDQVKEE